MIVISRDLVLAATDEIPLGTPLIGWHNLVTAASIESTTEDEDFPVSNLANPSTFLKWKGGVNTGDEYVTVTLNYLGGVDYIAIAKHNFGSANIVVSVEGRLDDGESPAEAWVELVQEQMPADDTPLLFRFEPQGLTEVRLRLQPGDDVPEAGVVYAGKLLVMERGIKIDVGHIPINLGRKSTIVNGMSESGNFLGRVVLKQFRQSVAEFSHIRPDWYRTNFDPFALVSHETPFFWAWNPTEYPNDVGFAWLTSDLEPEVDTVTRRMSVNLEMRGVA